MRNTMKRLLVAMLVLMMLGSVLMPAALATEKGIVANASSGSVYAGMKDTIILTNRYGTQLDNRNFRWRTSDSRVVSVNSKGVIWGKKPGYSAKITAVNKYDSSNKVSIWISVLRNKVDNICAKPSVSSVSYKKVGWQLKSVEIVSPSKVVVEIYLICNFPSRWRTKKINYLNDGVAIYNMSTGKRVKVIADGKTYSISGFKARSGGFVQTIKVTFSGSLTDCANIKLSKYLFALSTTGSIGLSIKK